MRELVRTYFKKKQKGGGEGKLGGFRNAVVAVEKSFPKGIFEKTKLIKKSFFSYLYGKKKKFYFILLRL